MAIHEIQAKSILQKSGIPGADYVVNPYTGCTHGCVYCYARFMKRFTGHAEPWGTFLDAKINAPELLQKTLARRKTPLQGEVFLCSVTDPYLPAEKQYRLTRKILKALLEHQIQISLLTKSALVVRDIDLLQQFQQASIGVSMMTIDDVVARHFEPRASAPSKRLDALRKLNDAGIRTYAFISPYIPEISTIEEIVPALEGIADEIGVEAINTKANNWRGVECVLAAHYPDRLEASRLRAKELTYWDVLEQQTRQLVTDIRTEYMGLFRH
jgi:DNA repair photolyase